MLIIYYDYEQLKWITNDGGLLLRIGIQGVKASFHDAASREYFSGEILDIIEFSSFRGLCQAMADGKLDYVVMAIENSIAGSILSNYHLLERFKFKIVGEIYHRIVMNLMVLPGVKLENLKYVQSHSMALLQCENFLAEYSHLKALEAADTAESAKYIKENNLHEYAAIASSLAADIYGLEIIRASIETNKQNYTRFFVIGNKKYNDQVPDKASLRFEIKDGPGSLLSVLEIFKNHNLNMTKLQSVPILSRPYEYSFHVDLIWSDINKYNQAIQEIEKKVINLIHFGEYKKSQRPIV